MGVNTWTLESELGLWSEDLFQDWSLESGVRCPETRLEIKTWSLDLECGVLSPDFESGLRVWDPVCTRYLDLDLGIRLPLLMFSRFQYCSIYNTI